MEGKRAPNINNAPSPSVDDESKGCRDGYDPFEWVVTLLLWILPLSSSPFSSIKQHLSFSLVDFLLFSFLFSSSSHRHHTLQEQWSSFFTTLCSNFFWLYPIHVSMKFLTHIGTWQVERNGRMESMPCARVIVRPYSSSSSNQNSRISVPLRAAFGLPAGRDIPSAATIVKYF